MKQNLMETAVGALVIAIALGFFIFMYSTTGVGKGSGGYHLTAKFKNVEGINVGSDVRMSGIKIGSVTNQSLDNKTFDAVLTFAIDPTIKLPDDSTAKITSEGLLGGKFIALEPGGSETILADGGTITYTQGALDLWALVSDYMFSGKKGSESGGGSSGQDGGQTQQQQPAPQSEQQPAEQPQQQSAPAQQQAPSDGQDGNASYPAPSIEPYPAPSNQGQSQSGQ
jgi:phospholipid/cholesterol/gamma-HCH transport system substrate-binding protein